MDNTRDNQYVAILSGAVSRRAALRGLGGVGIATTLGLATPGPISAAQTVGAWKTWILSAGDQLRPDPPPDETATEAELAELQALTADRDAATLDQIAYWDAGSPGYRWNEIAMQQTLAAG